MPVRIGSNRGGGSDPVRLLWILDPDPSGSLIGCNPFVWILVMDQLDGLDLAPCGTVARTRDVAVSGAAVSEKRPYGCGVSGRRLCRAVTVASRGSICVSLAPRRKTSTRCHPKWPLYRTEAAQLLSGAEAALTLMPSEGSLLRGNAQHERPSIRRGTRTRCFVVVGVGWCWWLVRVVWCSPSPRCSAVWYVRHDRDSGPVVQSCRAATRGDTPHMLNVSISSHVEHKPRQSRISATGARW